MSSGSTTTSGSSNCSSTPPRIPTTVGFRYRFDPVSGQYAHAAAIMLITPQGRVSRYFYGLEYSTKDIRLGLVEASENRIGTLADAQAWAAEIAGFAPLALQHAKRVLNDDGAYEEPWPAHSEMFDKAWSSQDVIEAQVARIEKRPPKFQGA